MEEFSDPVRQQARQQARMARLQAMSAPAAAQAPSQPMDIARMISSGLGGAGGYSLGGLAAGGLTAASLIPGPIGIGAKVARMAMPFVGGLLGSALAPAAVDAASPSIHGGINKAFQNAGPCSAPAAAATIGGMYFLNRGRRGVKSAPNPAVRASPLVPAGPVWPTQQHARLTMNPVAASGPGPGVRGGSVRSPMPTDLGSHGPDFEAAIRGSLPHKGPGVLLRQPVEPSLPVSPATMRRLGHTPKTPDTLEFATNPSDIRKMSPAQLLKVRNAENSRMAMAEAGVEDAQSHWNLSKSTGTHPRMIQQAKSPIDNAAHVYKTMEQFPDHARGALITSQELRKASGLSKEDFDRAVVALAKGRAIMPHHHDFAANMKPDELAELVDTAIADPARAEMHANHGRYWVGFAKPRSY